MSSAPDDLGKRLFSFIVVADTHVNERDDFSSSPFKTNRYANDRARFVFRQIAALAPAPAFAVHLGDMVHPLPSLPTFRDSVERYRELTALAGMPVHPVPGNHDVGDKNVAWMPAEKVCDAFLDTYRSLFGRDYYAFEHEGSRFIVVNSLLLNSGLAAEQAQARWLETEIRGSAGGRLFVFMHYPPYLLTQDERSHYDNIDQPARAWLLELLALPQVEAVFAGHVHNFWYDRIGQAEFYTLPSTAFVRHDFAEFSRLAPAAEFGRDDTGKFGYMRVDVHARGHVAHMVRTQGSGLARDDATAVAPVQQLVHPKTSRLDGVGVELRHPWTESMQIAATGGVQEFNRKRARNDYPLLALLEMGTRLAKVPEIDLAEPESAARMALLARIGCRFVVTTVGVPQRSRMGVAPREAGVVAFEVNAAAAHLRSRHEALHSVRLETGAEIYFSRIHTDERANFDGSTFSHVVGSGFEIDELDDAAALVGPLVAAGTLDGITVRISPEQPLPECGRRLIAFAERHRIGVLASLKLGGGIAREYADDRHNVLRVAQAALLSRACDRVRYVFDTFMDVDRGYSPRHGFIDRRFDPRPAARAFARLNALLSPHARIDLDADAPDGTLAARAGGQRMELLWGDRGHVAKALERAAAPHGFVDLVAGRQVAPADWLAAPSPAAGAPVPMEVVLLQHH